MSLNMLRRYARGVLLVPVKVWQCVDCLQNAHTFVESVERRVLISGPRRQCFERLKQIRYNGGA